MTTLNFNTLNIILAEIIIVAPWFKYVIYAPHRFFFVQIKTSNHGILDQSYHTVRSLYGPIQKVCFQLGRPVILVVSLHICPTQSYFAQTRQTWSDFYWCLNNESDLVCVFTGA